MKEQLKHVVKVTGTDRAFAAILADGHVVTWGDPKCGGDSSSVQSELVNVREKLGLKYVWVHLLERHKLIFSWQFGISQSQKHMFRTKIRRKKALTSRLSNLYYKLRIVGNCNAFAAILQSGKVVTWNCDYDKDELYDIQHIEHSLYDFIALRKDGTVVTWGNGRNWVVVSHIFLIFTPIWGR